MCCEECDTHYISIGERTGKTSFPVLTFDTEEQFQPDLCSAFAAGYHVRLQTPSVLNVVINPSCCKAPGGSSSASADLEDYWLERRIYYFLLQRICDRLRHYVGIRRVSKLIRRD